MHAGDKIAEKVISIVEKTGVPIERILSITTDNGANVKASCVALLSNLIDFLALGTRFRVMCVASVNCFPLFRDIRKLCG